jgi:hypothetical protein
MSSAVDTEFLSYVNSKQMFRYNPFPQMRLWQLCDGNISIEITKYLAVSSEEGDVLHTHQHAFQKT